MTKFLPIVALVCAVIVFALFPKWTVDDAYITYRYATNLATHGQLTWNVGERPIEGYTGVALPVMLAGFLQLGIQPETASHVIGIVSFFATGILLYVLLRKLSVSQLIAGVMMILYAAMPFLYTSALGGLETLLYIASITASLYAFACCLTPKTSPRSEIALMLLLLLTSLIRPEGVALSVALIIALAYVKFTLQRTDFWSFVGRVLIYAVPAISYFVWRMNYYGQLLPNTFYQKSANRFSLANLKGMNVFISVFFSVPLIAASVVLAIDTDVVWKETKERYSSDQIKKMVIGLGAILAFMALVILQQSHASLKMNFSYRFFAPFLPILFAIIGVALEMGYRRLRETRVTHPKRYHFVILLFGALLTYHLLQVAHRLKDEVSFAADYQRSMNHINMPTGKFLKEVVPTSEWLMVLYDAGAIPYFSGLKSVDMGGLNDEHIARKIVATTEERIDYFFSKHPGAAVFTSKEIDKVVHDPVAERIVADPRFAAYQLVKTFTSPDPNKKYFELVYLRQDLATASNK